MYNKLKKLSLFAFLWIVCVAPTFAFPDPPDGTDDPLPEAPIDNWMYILVALGAMVGIYFASKMLKKQVA